MQSTIEQTRARDYERFEANRRFEEMTDIAERIGYPIDTTIHYEMRDDAAYCLSDTTERPFHSQTWLALQRGKNSFNGGQAFQQERLRLEHEEALLVDAFGRGELGGNILIKFSKIPDAVVRGETSINGYRRDLLRSFVRVYYRTSAGIDCRLFTLDGNNDIAVARVGELLGIDTSRPSEEVLATPSLLHTSMDSEGFVGELVNRAKVVYDDGYYQVTGERVYAGSRYVDKQNAMQEIGGRPDLIDQHMKAISDIMKLARDGNDIEPLLETQRKRTAAAIKLASEGFTIDSSGDSSVSAEVANGNYDRECATDSAVNGMNQAVMTENVWSHGECQVCFAHTMVGSCKVCASCAAADDRGVDLLKLRERNMRRRERSQRLASSAITETFARTMPAYREKPKTKLIKERYGNHAIMKYEVVIGGARRVVRDRRTNEELAVV